MTVSEKYAERFRIRYESFRTGCDSAEEMGLWDKENLGEMEVFYLNDITAVILRLIASDGIISGKEVDFVNRAFEFDYTLEELSGIYENCREQIGDSFEGLFEAGIRELNRINPRLVKAYRDLLAIVCAAVAESDGVVSAEEAQEAQRWKRYFEDDGNASFIS